MRRVRTIRPDLSAIRVGLRKLQRALDRVATKARRLELVAQLDGSPSGPRRKLTITPKRRSQLKLQGQYMGYMRQLSPAQKKRVRAVKERSGHRAAIAVARSLRKGKPR
jgi:hypothetical protein